MNEYFSSDSKILRFLSYQDYTRGRSLFWLEYTWLNRLENRKKTQNYRFVVRLVWAYLMASFGAFCINSYTYTRLKFSLPKIWRSKTRALLFDVIVQIDQSVFVHLLLGPWWVLSSDNSLNFSINMPYTVVAKV